jgi:hypothetical protein
VAASVAAGSTIAGCSERAADEPEVTTDGLKAELESRLSMPVRAQAPVLTSAALVNVDAVYTGESRTESLLAVVFDDPRATSQILGTGDPSSTQPAVVRYRNAVLFYEHEPGTTSHLPDVRAAVRSATEG